MNVILKRSILGLAAVPLAAKDYLHIPGPVKFDRSEYDLVWSTHPSSLYFKQEYLPAGEITEHFSKMILIEVLQSNMPLQNAVSGKVQEITDRRKDDPVAVYHVSANADKSEYILDFLMSSGGVLEFNAYRYKEVMLNGQPTIVLFANSRRAYGDDRQGFLSALPAMRSRVIRELAGYALPAISINLR